MYLDNWMIGMVIISYGICAVLCRRQGFVDGATRTLAALQEQRYIRIEEDGQIKRWTPHPELPVPVKKARTRKKK